MGRSFFFIAVFALLGGLLTISAKRVSQIRRDPGAQKPTPTETPSQITLEDNAEHIDVPPVQAPPEPPTQAAQAVAMPDGERPRKLVIEPIAPKRSE